MKLNFGRRKISSIGLHVARQHILFVNFLTYWQTDFSGRVINNDHFLYWGETTKQADDGVEYHFHLVEQTEFLDDASFQPFKGIVLLSDCLWLY